MGQAQSVNIADVLALVTFIIGSTIIIYNLCEQDVNVPTVGVGSGLLAVHRASQNSVTKLCEWVSAGYNKYRDQVFRVRSLHGWNYVVSGQKLIDELRKAPDSILSFDEANSEILQAHYTMGKHFIPEGRLITSLVKSRLTRSLPGLFPGVIDEIGAAFEDEIGKKADTAESDWAEFLAVGAFMNVVCRTSNRVFVGLPLCRDSDYIQLNVQYTIDLVTAANKIRYCPWFLKPLAGYYLTPMPRAMKLARRAAAKVVEERKLLSEEHGKGADWEGKPNDFLQWMIDLGEPADTTVEALIKQIVRLNFAAIHTTAMSFTFALYHIAADPERYLEPIRQEVHEALSKYGWTGSAVEKMYKADSLLKESLRFHGLTNLSISRKVMEDFTFSDGSRVSKGVLLSAASRPVHFDPDLYPRADEFDGWRFVKNSQNEPSDEKQSAGKQFVDVGLDFLPFGIGRHACPGRFWAGNEMKAMLAYMVIHYDFKMANAGVVPPELWYGPIVFPDPTVKMLVRRRKDVVQY